MSQIRVFRIIALVEGSSFLAIAVRRDADEVRDGNVRSRDRRGSHSWILFLAYVAQLVKLRTTHQWDNIFSFSALLASLLPFGPFVSDRYLREKEVATN